MTIKALPLFSSVHAHPSGRAIFKGLNQQTQLELYPQVSPLATKNRLSTLLICQPESLSW